MKLLAEEEKLKDLACEREREAWKGYRLKNFLHTPMTLENFM
jgi:hypothetical protein